jgi:hypothetical protein
LIAIYKDGSQSQIKPSQLHQITGVPYMPGIEFINFKTMRQIGWKSKGRQMDYEHKWLSAYFRKEVLSQTEHLDVSLRWIDDEIGWGVFAERDFQKTEFIAEYAGLVRKRIKRDCKNAYCFEYPIEIGESSPYVIDAENIGGISRYINHSDEPNLTSLSVHVEGFNHIVLYTIKQIPKGAQLCYDYGPGYWKARGNPKQLHKTKAIN